MIYLGNLMTDDTLLGNNRVKVKSLVNILDFSTRTNIIDTVAEGGAWGSESARHFSEDQFWVGLTRNNYFDTNPGCTYTINGDDITITTAKGGYGIAIPFKLIPGARYFSKADENVSMITFGVYDAEGHQTRFINHADAQRGVIFNANEWWLTVCVSPSAVGITQTCVNPKVYYTMEG